IVHADGSGVVVVPAGITEEVHRRARAVEEMERAISRAVGQGSSLRQARSRYRYHDVALPQRG
ncbi:MAG TPA: hypothetical protein VHH34_02250, partial [Pseudonocardiaceae bacterium]|nr:hypothetical protein [Pseudonocardiaceae bacterium]